MKNFFVVLTLSIFIFISILSISGYIVYLKKEKDRKYILADNIALNTFNRSKTIPLLDNRKSSIEKLNNSIVLKNVINDKSIESTKIKLEKEKKLIKEISAIWKKPFNYVDGNTCYIDLYFKNTIIYKIYDCTNNDAILKRSFEIAIDEYLKNNNLNFMKNYNYENKFSFFIY